jgi:ABC-type nitrate/sulfonate/bicarbonate transport system permease component
MSCEVEILPHPIDATLIRLLGAFFPNTLAGTMVGIPLKIRDPVANLADVLRKFLRLCALSNFFMAMLLFWVGNDKLELFL